MLKIQTPDTLFTPDSLSLVQDVKKTIAMMHQTMLQMQPIVERQLEVIQLQKLICNVGLVIILITFLTCLYFALRYAQGVKKFNDLRIQKRLLIVILSVWLLIVASFNIFPGMVLMSLDQEIKQKTVQDSQSRLFGIEGQQHK